MTDTLTIRKLDDMHIDLRNGPLLEPVLHQVISSDIVRAVVMPNLRPRSVLTAADVRRYREEILAAAAAVSRGPGFESPFFTPLMTIQLTDETTPEIIRDARAAGAIGGKLYPRRQTTNWENGVLNPMRLRSVYRAMEETGMILQLHGECVGMSLLDAERGFLPVLMGIASEFPRLKIVLEHISTASAVDVVRTSPDTVAATITAHHLVLTIDDVIGCPHNLCTPVAKTAEDRMALRRAATSGSPKFFFGSDSTPHLKEEKEGPRSAFGCYTAPIIPELLATVFEEMEALDRLEDFTSRFGATFYDLPLNGGKVTLDRDLWTFPDRAFDGIVPFGVGRELRWRSRTLST